MTRLLTSRWMTLPVSALVYLGATFLFWQAPKLPSHLAHVVSKGVFWDFKSPEADQLIAELKEEKKGLDKREQQLNELAQRLETQRTELDGVRQSVQKMQEDFDKNVVRVQDEETANLKKLAKVYSAMTPETAASIFGQMDDQAVAKIMVFMKEGDTAAILEALTKQGEEPAKRAATLSERLRVSAYRSNTAK
jgi:flagellar motility protein MotE (MotC chaperone)